MKRGIFSVLLPVVKNQLTGKQVESVVVDSMEAIREQARLTFANREGPSGENLGRLHTLMNALRATDVRLDHGLLEQRPSLAPVTYVEIHEDPDFTISMFILRPGSCLPLHDHPSMHGLCKVVHGKVQVKSYTLKTEPSQLVEEQRIDAKREEDLLVTEKDPAVLLTPKIRNIHEISSVDGPAAFVDVLAPPYDPHDSGDGYRPCHYYVECEIDISPGDLIKLVKTNKAPGYWTDCAPYLGP